MGESAEAFITDIISFEGVASYMYMYWLVPSVIVLSLEYAPTCTSDN